MDDAAANAPGDDGPPGRAGYRRSAGSPRGQARRRELLRTLLLTGKLSPTLFGLFMQQMRIRVVRRLPIAFGWLTKRGDAATARWMRPVLTSAGVRRDTVRMLRAAAADTGFLLAAAERLPDFRRPALVAWAREDRVMPPEHGRRLAKLLPQGQLAEIDDSYTLVPLDQPARLAQVIGDFIAAPRPAAAQDRAAR